MKKQKIYSAYDDSNWPRNESVFKCRDCGNKYPESMASNEDQGICKWCSGELK